MICMHMNRVDDDATVFLGVYECEMQVAFANRVHCCSQTEIILWQISNKTTFTHRNQLWMCRNYLAAHFAGEIVSSVCWQ